MTPGPAQRATLSVKLAGVGGPPPPVQTQREAMGSFTPRADSDSVLPYALDDSHITALIEFFQTLDRWDREAHAAQVM
jgi:hypothetical protein